MTKIEMLKEYNAHAKAASYILGYVHNHKVYMLMADHIDPEMLTVEKASRNQGENLRLRIRKAHKEALLLESVCLGEDTILVTEKYNKGEIFEKIVTEYFGQIWVKDTVPFYMAGDINLNGIEVQIKFDAATLVNTKLLAKLGAAA